LPSTPDSSLLDLVPVIPVVVVDDLASAVPVARALVAGGLPVIELTLRTPVALDAIRAIAEEVPEIAVGAGTVVEPGQAKEAAAAGASFLVSPGATPTLLGAMRDTGLPFLPGTATVSEVLAALEAGCTELKFFPAEAYGDAARSRPSTAPRSRRPPGRGGRAGSATRGCPWPRGTGRWASRRRASRRRRRGGSGRGDGRRPGPGLRSACAGGSAARSGRRTGRE
jgi:2-dehydro-3-deoxyphosphogluconate aldolase/(4S)-4-hydroxy-2-oxoglutarate aldolase